MGKILNYLQKKITKNFTCIPLFYVNFNYQKFIKDGVKGSCQCRMSPEFKDDTELQQMLNNVIDYIRNNYDMEQFTKI